MTDQRQHNLHPRQMADLVHLVHFPFTSVFWGKVNKIIAGRLWDEVCSFTSFTSFTKKHIITWACASARARIRYSLLRELRVNEVNERGVSRRRLAKNSFTMSENTSERDFGVIQ